MNEDNNCLEPFYDCEDIECACTKNGIDSEWVWDADQYCYVCAGCNEIQ